MLRGLVALGWRSRVALASGPRTTFRLSSSSSSSSFTPFSTLSPPSPLARGACSPAAWSSPFLSARAGFSAEATKAKDDASVAAEPAAVEGSVLRPPPQSEDEAAQEVRMQWTSRAMKDASYAYHRNLVISPFKLQEIVHQIRGMSVDEALVQLKFSQRRKAVFVANCIKAAATSGVNNFNMDRSRLYIGLATSTKAVYSKRLNIHAKGRMGIKHKYRANLTIAVKEHAPVKGETHVGLHRHGRHHSTIRRSLELMKLHKDTERPKTNSDAKSPSDAHRSDPTKDPRKQKDPMAPPVKNHGVKFSSPGVKTHTNRRKYNN